MLQRHIKTLLQPVRLMGRRFFMIPTLEEQQYVSFRGCLYTAATFTTRNYVAGDYLEFGVWRGDSFSKAYHAIREMRAQHTAWLNRHVTYSSNGHGTPEFTRWREWKPKFFAFDSFAGLPSTGDQMQEEWAAGSYACSEAEFKANIAREGVNLSDVVTVPGFYENSLTPELKRKLRLTRAAIVHIDCDLYDSTMRVLDFVTDLLTQGSVIVFDDWFFNQGRKDCGEQKACDEWLRRNPHIELTPYWQEPQPMSFIVNIRD
jgi:O-methyltransferase